MEKTPKICYPMMLPDCSSAEQHSDSMESTLPRPIRVGPAGLTACIVTGVGAHQSPKMSHAFETVKTGCFCGSPNIMNAIPYMMP